MIRLVQRRLIIPRGDTGTFSVPVLSSYNSGDAAVFSIIDPRTHRRVYNQLMYVTDNVLSVKFEHGDTVNLPVGKFLWDIKFYQDPVIEDNQVVSGKEVDSYYAAFTMPECEIRQTGDNMLTADDAPGSTLTPQHINAISAALFALNEAVEKTETNVTHYPTIIDGEWNVWDANLGDYTTTGIEATGNGIASIEKTNTVGLVDTYTVNFTDGTTFLYNITNGSSIRSITKQSTSGLQDTYVIIYTDGNSTTFTVTNGATPNITIGTVQEGPIAAASITGSAANPVLNLTLPNANVPTKVSELDNDSGYLTSETDPTVPQWAKQPTKPTYTAQEVGALPSNTYIPEKTSDLTNDSNYAVDANYVHTDNNYTTAEKEKLSGVAAGAEVNVNADWNANSGDAQILNKPTKVSDFTNDAGYLTTETDPTVPAWAKAAQKPTYTAAEVGAPTVAEMQQAIANVNTMKIHICAQGEYNAETGVPTIQNPDTQTFYLVPGGEGSNLFIEWVYVNNGWERFGSADVDLSNYVQKTDYATSSNAGVVKISSALGVDILNGFLAMSAADHTYIQDGTHTKKAITPNFQHESTFYGLAKAAGDSTQSASLNPVGTYTDDAKAAIQQMLDVPSTDDIPEVPVQDVQVNGASIVDAQGVANVPIGSTTAPGVLGIAGSSYGIGLIGSKLIYVSAAIPADVKAGNQGYKPVVPQSQHQSTFYGLAKAAGADEKNSTLPVGQYTDTAKTAIRTMLGATSNNVIAVQDTQPTDPDTKIWLPETPETPVQVPTVAEMNAALNGKISDVQINGTSVVTNGVANVPVANASTPGVVKVSTGLAVDSTGLLKTNNADATVIKAGTYNGSVLTPGRQHQSTFYGLAKAAGADMASSSNPIGTYTPEAKGAIQSMLGVSDLIATAENSLVASRAYAIGDVFTANGKLYKATAAIATNDTIVLQNNGETISGSNAEEIKLSDYAVHDVQVNGVSMLSSGVANVPVASTSDLGVSGVEGSFGILVNNNGKLYTNTPNLNEIKAGSQGYKPIVSANAHTATFYGLAKASGDTTQSASSNAVGTYTDNAKASIKAMLGIVDGSTGTVSISGTTPAITAVENTRYVCGEVSTLSFTPPASGISIVRFTSGTTAAVLTLPSTVKFPEWFDATSLEANTIYEICITDGIYGAVMSWAL